MLTETYLFAIDIFIFFFALIGKEFRNLSYSVFASLMAFVFFMASVSLSWVTYNSIVFYFTLITLLYSIIMIYESSRV